MSIKPIFPHWNNAKTIYKELQNLLRMKPYVFKWVWIYQVSQVIAIFAHSLGTLYSNPTPFHATQNKIGYQFVQSKPFFKPWGFLFITCKPPDAIFEFQFCLVRLQIIRTHVFNKLQISLIFLIILKQYSRHQFMTKDSTTLKDKTTPLNWFT